MRKNQDTAVRLAALLGATGLHKLYLNGFPRGLGRLGALALFLWVESYFLVGVLVLWGLFEAFRLDRMDVATFEERYNRGTALAERKSRRIAFPIPRFSGKLRSGTAKFRNYDLPGALSDFLEALQEDPENPAVHFNLACTYSLMEDAPKAFTHLERSVVLGLEDPARILLHDALAWLRVHPEFDAFAQRGYRLSPQALPPPETGGLLAQLKKLEEERRSGALGEEAYRELREKLFRP